MVEDRTIISILQARAKEKPEGLAYTFLQNGKIPSQSLTYQQLAQKVRAIAAQLQARVPPNSTVLLLYPNNLEHLNLKQFNRTSQVISGDIGFIDLAIVFSNNLTHNF
ncbi:MULTISPECIES: hypothetical protein [Spirulina sp. CCY15215]|uniref:hypothetical protein n=1 Tax=Spirulina sp. CCY15215 TaxID=2767591 RepID=UPI00195121D8|nr:hypothetical protein [Spirulina major]